LSLQGPFTGVYRVPLAFEELRSTRGLGGVRANEVLAKVCSLTLDKPFDKRHLIHYRKKAGAYPAALSENL